MELSLELNKKYTFADYLTWLDDTRRELYEGFIHLMSPAPTRSHQRISGYIFTKIWNFLEGKKCEVFNAPFDVRLPKNGEKDNEKIFTVVQPDICIICDSSKLDEKGCIGAPDMIVEIVSPSSSKNDVSDKFKIYEMAGVREYWIVFPYEKVIAVYILNDQQKFESHGMFASGSIVPVHIFDRELSIDTNAAFAGTE